MKNAEDFDNLIRRKAEEANPEFSEASWEKAQQLLDARNLASAVNSGARKTIGILPFVVAGVLGLSAATGVYINSYFTPTNRTIAQKGNTTNSLTDVISENNESQNVLAENNAEINNNFVVSENENTPSSSIINSSSEKSTSENIENITTITNANTSANVVNSKNKLSSNTSANVNTTKTYNNSKNLFTAKSKTTNKNVSTSSGNQNNKSVQQNQQSNTTIDSNNSGLNSEEFDFVMLNATAINLVNNGTEDAEIISQSFNSAKKDGDYHEPNRRKSNFLNAEAGATYNTGWCYNKKKDGNGLNWYLGLNYGFYTGKKTSFAFGLQTFNFSNTNNPFFITNSTEYGFGSTTTHTNLTTTNLQYVSVPIEFNFQPSRLHIISVGVNAGTVVFAKNKVESFTVTDGVKESIEVVKTNGIYDAVNSKNLMLTATYKFNVKSRWWINVEANYGMSDVFNKKSILSGKQTTTGVRLGLTYTIFDK